MMLAASIPPLQLARERKIPIGFMVTGFSRTSFIPEFHEPNVNHG